MTAGELGQRCEKDEELAVSITVAPDAATGSRTLLVALVGTGSGPASGAAGTCSGCLTVT